MPPNNNFRLLYYIYSLCSAITFLINLVLQKLALCLCSNYPVLGYFKGVCMELVLKSREYNVIQSPKYVMILLHGYGSNADDLISLAPDLAEVLPDTIFVSPNAPFNFEGGFMGGRINGIACWIALRRPLLRGI